MKPAFALPVVAVLLVASMVSLVACGMLGVRKPPGPQNFDGAVLYAAGCAWRDGRNPHDHAELSASVEDELNIHLEILYFFYPPQVSRLCLAQPGNPAHQSQVGRSRRYRALAGIARMNSYSRIRYRRERNVGQTNKTRFY